MFHAFQTLAGAAVMERVTLLLNHVLASEAVAMDRLRGHAGGCIHLQFQAWPALLPPLPSTAFRVTPAGLLEWCTQELVDAAALTIEFDASNPALMALTAMTGGRPSLQVTGDAALASDVNWLIDNLRWDIVDDLEKLVGPAAAHQLGQFGGAIAPAVKAAAVALARFSKAPPGGGQPVP